jgi:hypothetical protein
MKLVKVKILFTGIKVEKGTDQIILDLNKSKSVRIYLDTSQLVCQQNEIPQMSNSPNFPFALRFPVSQDNDKVGSSLQFTG